MGVCFFWVDPFGGFSGALKGTPLFVGGSKVSFKEMDPKIPALVGFKGKGHPPVTLIWRQTDGIA